MAEEAGAAAPHAPLLTALPSDLLVSVLTRLGLGSLQDLASAAMTCRRLRDLVVHDHHGLWGTLCVQTWGKLTQPSAWIATAVRMHAADAHLHASCAGAMDPAPTSYRCAPAPERDAIRSSHSRGPAAARNRGAVRRAPRCRLALRGPRTHTVFAVTGVQRNPLSCASVAHAARVPLRGRRALYRLLSSTQQLVGYWRGVGDAPRGSLFKLSWGRDCVHLEQLQCSDQADVLRMYVRAPPL